MTEKMTKQLQAGTLLRSGVLVAVLAFFGTAKADDSKEISDQDIEHAVAGELLVCDQVASHRIDMECRQGVVTLSGTVSNLLEKRHAKRHVQRLKGVRSIINKVSVRSSGLDDEEIEQNIKEALFRDPAAESFEIEVQVQNGTAQLKGTVESYAERQLSEEVAAGVKGVRKIDNQIAVNYTRIRPDGEIKNDIKGQLGASAWIADGLIDVEVEDGNVSLSGAVGSAAEKHLARAKAWVAGVKSVDTDGLEVNWWLRDEMERQSPYANITDSQIEKAIRDAFVYDPRVLSIQPEIEVKSGTVTLSGTVSDLRAKRAAEEDARNTRGVWRVKNYLRVRGSESVVDSKIEENVKDAIERDLFLESHEITPVVSNGHVKLYGTVDTYFERSRAENVVSAVKGVVAVLNRLSVSLDFTEFDDVAIEADIKDQFRWSPYVDEDDIEVSVTNGVATLTGTVDSWMERGAARDNAIEGGARRVINRLAVERGT